MRRHPDNRFRQTPVSGIFGARSKSAFTLVETVMAASLALAVFLAAATFLFQGMRFFERLSVQSVSDEGTLFFERITRDLRNAVPSSAHSFTADAGRVNLVSFLPGRSDGGVQNAEPMLVSYRWDGQTKRVFRSQQPLFQTQPAQADQTVLSEVEGFRTVSKQEGRGLPSRVTVFIDLERNGRPLHFKKHITLLTGYALSE